MSLYKILNLCLLAILLSCSTTRPSGKTEEEILFREAEAFIKKERFVFASDKLREIKARFPYSDYARLSQLKLADIAYEQNNYIEAIVAYQSYKDLYPGNDQIPYVTYRLGESFYKQLPKTYDRDIEEARQAIAYFQQVITRYPSSEYFEKAKVGKALCEQMLRDKEQYIADFYLKTKVYEGARYRYKKILREFNDTKLIEHSMIGAVTASFKMNDKDTCTRDAEAFLGVLNNNEIKTKEALVDLKSKCEGL